MRDFQGATAFVTGGASGIGLALAQALGQRGANVMIADIEEQAIDGAIERLRAAGIRADGVVVDVADRTAVADAAQRTIDAFGKVHIVCNNAGVAVAAPILAVAPGDWKWIVDVNLNGVVNGVETFVPLIDAHGEGGHIVNTASMAGLMPSAAFEPYAATKAAVVGMTEGWALQLQSRNIGMSVLCPGFVKSRIFQSERNRGDRYGEDKAASRQLIPGGAIEDNLQIGIPADRVALRVIEAIEANELYILTHLEYVPVVEARFAALAAAFDRSANSPILARGPRQAIPGVMQREMPKPQD